MHPLAAVKMLLSQKVESHGRSKEKPRMEKAKEGRKREKVQITEAAMETQRRWAVWRAEKNASCKETEERTALS